MSEKKLTEEIKSIERNVISDGYLMSLGEIINLYNDKEIIINPKYQRVFRRNKDQKSKLIESFLLLLPIPGIFVAENEKGQREVVDGLQRISTLLEFVGILDGLEYISDRNKLNSGLSSTLYLPSLQGMKWENKNHKEFELPSEYKLRIKRTKLYISILKNTGDLKAKYELFQRLNTGGSSLSNQEVRNCMMIDKNENLYDIILTLSNSDSFKKTISYLSEQELTEKKDMEMVLRYLSIKLIENHSKNISISEIIDSLVYKIIGLGDDKNIFNKIDIDLDKEITIFYQTFSVLDDILGENSFNSLKDGKYKKQLIYPAFDVIAQGIAYNIEKGNISILTDKLKIKSKIENLRDNVEFGKARKEGNTSELKLKLSNKFGKDYFNLSN